MARKRGQLVKDDACSPVNVAKPTSSRPKRAKVATDPTPTGPDDLPLVPPDPPEHLHETPSSDSNNPQAKTKPEQNVATAGSVEEKHNSNDHEEPPKRNGANKPGPKSRKYYDMEEDKKESKEQRPFINHAPAQQSDSDMIPDPVIINGSDLAKQEYRCILCRHLYLEKDQYLRHLEDYHKNVALVFQCGKPDCHKIKATQRLLKLHITQEHDRYPEIEILERVPEVAEIDPNDADTCVHGSVDFMIQHVFGGDSCVSTLPRVLLPRSRYLEQWMTNPKAMAINIRKFSDDLRRDQGKNHLGETSNADRKSLVAATDVVPDNATADHQGIQQREVLVKNADGEQDDAADNGGGAVSSAPGNRRVGRPKRKTSISITVTGKRRRHKLGNGRGRKQESDASAQSVDQPPLQLTAPKPVSDHVLDDLNSAGPREINYSNIIAADNDSGGAGTDADETPLGTNKPLAAALPPGAAVNDDNNIPDETDPFSAPSPASTASSSTNNNNSVKENALSSPTHSATGIDLDPPKSVPKTLGKESVNKECVDGVKVVPLVTKAAQKYYL